MRLYSIIIAALLSLLILFLPSGNDQSLTIYSGRSKALVEPLIERFEEETGIRVRVRYGGTTQLAVALLEEGRRSPADLFWAQDAGALGAVNAGNMFTTLPGKVTEMVPEEYRGNEDKWVATSGRARVLAYSTKNVDESELPQSIFDLDDPKWKNRIGWAPANGSFQAFLTAMRQLAGDEKTRQWLIDVKNNGVENYANNNALLQAIAAGEIDLALTNHYYLHRYRQTNPGFPVDQTFFEPGDPGNLVNVSGIGVLNTSSNQEAAHRFIGFLLSEPTQDYFADEIFEYPVNPEADLVLHQGNPVIISPDVDLDELSDLEATLRMLREVGLL